MYYPINILLFYIIMISVIFYPVPFRVIQVGMIQLLLDEGWNDPAVIRLDPGLMNPAVQ